MATPVWNLERTRGETVVITVAVTEDDGTVSDLAGYTGEMEARASADDDGVLLTGEVIIDTATGLVQGTFAAADTATAEWAAAVYDMRIVLAGVIEYVARGTLRLRPAVTR